MHEDFIKRVGIFHEKNISHMGFQVLTTYTSIIIHLIALESVRLFAMMANSLMCPHRNLLDRFSTLFFVNKFQSGSKIAEVENDLIHFVNRLEIIIAGHFTPNKRI